MSTFDSEDEYSYIDDDDMIGSDHELDGNGGNNNNSKSGDDTFVLCDEDVIALVGPLAEEHAGNQLLRSSIRKSAATLSASSLYLTAKGRFAVLNSDDEWIQADQDTALEYLEKLLRRIQPAAAARQTSSAASSYSLIDKPDDTDTLASASVAGKEEGPFAIEGWDLLGRGKESAQPRIELDLSSVLSQLNQMDVDTNAQDSKASASQTPTNASSYTLPGSAAAATPLFSAQKGDASSVSTGFSFVLTDGKQACRRCTFLNEPSATVCVVCDFALGAANPTLDSDAEIAVRLGREEEERASRMVLDVIHEEETKTEDNPLERSRTFAEKVSKTVKELECPITLRVRSVPEKDMLYLCNSFISIGDRFWFLNRQSFRSKPWNLDETFCIVQTDDEFKTICEHGFRNGTCVWAYSVGIQEEKTKNLWVCVALLGKRDVDFFDFCGGFEDGPRRIKLKDGKQLLPLACCDTRRDAELFWNLMWASSKTLFTVPAPTQVVDGLTVSSTTSLWDRAAANPAPAREHRPVEPKEQGLGVFISEFFHRLRILNECTARFMQTTKEPIPRFYASREQAIEWLTCRNEFEQRSKLSSCNANPYMGFFSSPVGVNPAAVLSREGLGNSVTISHTSYWAAAHEHNRPYWIALVLLGEVKKDYNTFDMHTGEQKETFFTISKWRQILPFACVPKRYTYEVDTPYIESLIRETVLRDWTSPANKLDIESVMRRAEEGMERGGRSKSPTGVLAT